MERIPDPRSDCTLSARFKLDQEQNQAGNGTVVPNLVHAQLFPKENHVCPHLGKGKAVEVMGPLRPIRIHTDENGLPRFDLEVIATVVGFAPARAPKDDAPPDYLLVSEFLRLCGAFPEHSAHPSGLA